MTQEFLTVLLLVTAMAAIAALARRFELTPAIAFLLSGLALAFIPGLPRIALAPQVILLVVLPPLIYSAGVAMSWREFRSNLRPIALLAIGCVIFTTWAVAAAAHWGLGLPWGTGFVLGAIVSPPDVVAPLAIARRLSLPRRILVILEGEGLANDATALILYRFAVLAVSTGAFSATAAAGSFVAILVCEVAFGIAVGWLSLRLRQWAHDQRVEITLSLLTPYLAYWVPEHLGGSGVIATVAAGLYVSWNGPLLISAATRLQGIFFWDLVIWLIEGLLFLLMGFQLRLMMLSPKAASVHDIAVATALTAAVVIIARFVWVFPGTYLARLLSRRIRERDPTPPWRYIVVIGFTGIRGVVSLAVALALPLTLPDGSDFPHRDLIQFTSFGVIFITLLGIGLTLPALVRWFGLPEHGEIEARAEREAEFAARREILQSARQSLEDITTARELPDGLVQFLEARHTSRTLALPDPPQQPGAATPPTMGASVVRELIAVERQVLHRLLREGSITDETRRKIERDLDLEEAVINNRQNGSVV
ncbi:MAG: Na+/H+ antiporter [Xanthobacteraceae bacterium]